MTRDLQDKHQQYDLMMKHFTDISEPYEYEKENATTGEIEIVKKLSDCVGGDRSLLKLVKLFLSQSKRGAEQSLDPTSSILDGDQQAAIGEDEDQADEENESIASDCEGGDQETGYEAFNTELLA